MSKIRYSCSSFPLLEYQSTIKELLLCFPTFNNLFWTLLPYSCVFFLACLRVYSLPGPIHCILLEDDSIDHLNTCSCLSGKYTHRSSWIRKSILRWYGQPWSHFRTATKVRIFFIRISAHDTVIPPFLRKRPGRSWTSDELRLKSNTDLHKLWSVAKWQAILIAWLLTGSCVWRSVICC